MQFVGSLQKRERVLALAAAASREDALNIEKLVITLKRQKIVPQSKQVSLKSPNVVMNASHKIHMGMTERSFK